MRYSNPRIQRQTAEEAAKGENSEFLLLLLKVAVLASLLVLAVDQLALWAAPKMSFATERELADDLGMDSLLRKTLSTANQAKGQQAQTIEQALTREVEQILHHLDAPADMKIQVHYLDSPKVNAMASLGGHLWVFRGLLEQVEYQEELDAVLAHELAHVQQRHVVKHMARGLAVAMTLSMVGLNRGAGSMLFGDGQALRQLAYTRDAEREADEIARQAMLSMHGSSAGAAHMFERFAELEEEQGSSVALDWLGSHPQLQERIDAMGGAADVSRLTPVLAELKPKED